MAFDGIMTVDFPPRASSPSSSPARSLDLELLLLSTVWGGEVAEGEGEGEKSCCLEFARDRDRPAADFSRLGGDVFVGVFGVCLPLELWL